MTRVGPSGFDPDDPDSEWSEIVDAAVPRVDLVSAAANGASFLIMKGSADGLMSPEQIRSMIHPATPQQKAATMSDYVPGTRILKTSRSIALRKAKAKRVAVYNSAGKLVGTCDPADITALEGVAVPGTPVQPAPKPEGVSGQTGTPEKPTPKPKAKKAWTPDKSTAPSTPEDATDGPAADVAKALQGAGFRHGSQPFAKSAGRSVDERYISLVKSVDRGTQGQLGDAVAHAAMVLQFANRIPGQEAVRLAKSIALDLASVEARKPAPSIEAAAAAFKRARPIR